MCAIGFIVGFILFQYQAVRSVCWFLLAWCILGSGWMIAIVTVGALVGLAQVLLALRQPDEARSSLAYARS